MALSTEAAESSETSCSPLRPPKRIPTRIFFMGVVAILGRGPGLPWWKSRIHGHDYESKQVRKAIGCRSLVGALTWQQTSRLFVTRASNKMELYLQWQVNPFNMRQLRV